MRQESVFKTAISAIWVRKKRNANHLHPEIDPHPLHPPNNNPPLMFQTQVGVKLWAI